MGIFRFQGWTSGFFSLPLVAFANSFLTSMGGVSGALLLLPFQMSFLGCGSPSVNGANQVFSVFAIPGGVYRHMREGRKVWLLGALFGIGGAAGMYLGARPRNIFPAGRSRDS